MKAEEFIEKYRMVYSFGMHDQIDELKEDLESVIQSKCKELEEENKKLKEIEKVARNSSLQVKFKMTAIRKILTSKTK